MNLLAARRAGSGLPLSTIQENRILKFTQNVYKAGNKNVAAGSSRFKFGEVIYPQAL